MIPINPSGSDVWSGTSTPYQALGGDQAVRELVDTFYDIIEEESPGLRAMLPKNTATSREKLYEFLSGWLGGPQLYEQKRVHPRLRMRHFPFPIGRPEADEWMRCMRQAMDQTGVDSQLREYLDARLGPLAQHMINR